MMRRPVTTAEWEEFADAIQPYWPRGSASSFYGRSQNSSGNYGPDGTSNLWAAGVTLDLVAAYANWMHNGKRNDPASFYSGVYDFSTFTYNDDGELVSADLRKSANAKYWIPNLDESLKAIYYDPNRWGDGDGGWWSNVNLTEDPLAPGLPGLGDVAGLADYLGGADLGMYPETQSAWGIIDAACTLPTWTSTPSNEQNGYYYTVGNLAETAGGPWYLSFYRVASGAYGYSLPFGWQGVRLASAIPSPYSANVLLIAMAAVAKRRRKTGGS